MTNWRTQYLPQILAAVLALLLLQVAFINVPSSAILFAEDQALWFATAQRLLEGDIPLLGPPSHVGGRHLGAIAYAIVSGCLFLASGNLQLAVQLLSCISLISIILLALLVRRLVNPTWGWWSIVVVLTFVSSGDMVQVVRIPWHAHLLVFFVMTFMWASHALFTKGLSRAPGYLLASTLVIQTHYAAIPLVGVFTLAWLARLRSPTRREEAFKALPLLGSPSNLALLLMTLALWVPIIWHDLSYGRNTLWAIISNSGGHGTHAGIGRAVANLGYLFRLFLAGGQGFKELWDDSRVTVYVFLALSSLWFFVRGRQTVREDSRAWMYALLLCVPAYLLATARQPAPLRPYYLYPLLALPFIYGTVAISGAIKAYRKGLPERALALACIILWGESIRFGVFYFDRNSENGGISEYSSLRHGIEVGEILKRATRELPSAETHTVMGRGEVKIIKDAYLYHLGPEYYGQINFSEKLQEVSAFSDKPASPYAFLMVCPRPPPHHARAMWKELKQRWSKRSEVDLSTCSTCRECRMWVLEERATQPRL